MPPRLSVLLLPLLAAPLAAQTITQNTRLRDHVHLASAGWVAGNTGYRTATHRYLLQTSDSGLAIVDTTDPGNCTVVRTITGIIVKEVKVLGSYAYATTDAGPTQVIDLSNPAAASVVATIASGAHTLQIDAARRLLYLNIGGVELRIHDLGSNPLNPPLVTTWPVPVHDCNLEGNLVYVCGNASVWILDASNLAAITQLGSFYVGGFVHSADLYVAPSGRKYLLVCSEGGPERWLKIYDVTNPAAPAFVSQYLTAATATIHNVFVRGAYAYLAYYKEGLRVVDVSDPAAPQEVGVFDPNPTNSAGGVFSGTWDVYPYHDAVYVGEMYDTNGPGTQGAWIVDFFPGFGTGCPGSTGVPTQWWSFGPPSPGNQDFALRLADAAPGAPALLILGSSNTAWHNYALPLDLGPVGGNGCRLYSSTEFVAMLPTDAAGAARLALPIPAAIGGTFWCQWGVLDGGAPNGLRLATTNGGKLILQ